jgi:hypothetical protein
MSAPFDEADFYDGDLQSQPPGRSPVPGPPPVAGRPPTQAELEAKLGQAQSKIAELRRVQEELERERAALEDARRRRQEFEHGRAEMLQHLTRGIGLLEKAEFEARRDAEQMSKTLDGFRQALTQVEAIRDQNWTEENWQGELTKALTTLENARMEWNGARLKWNVLEGGTLPTGAIPPTGSLATDALGQKSFWQLCRLGLALTWPVALLGLLAFLALVVHLARN